MPVLTLISLYKYLKKKTQKIEIFNIVTIDKKKS